MRTEAPQRALVVPQPPEVHARAVQVVNAPERTRVQQLAKPQHPGVMHHQVPDHPDASGVARQPGDRGCVRQRHRERFLDEDVLSRLERGTCQRGVCRRWSGDDHRIDRSVGQHEVGILPDRDRRKSRRDPCEGAGIAMMTAESSQRGSLAATRMWLMPQAPAPTTASRGLRARAKCAERVHAGQRRVLRMHVLVTGAAGFIGSHTCEKLVARGHRVTGVDAFDDSSTRPRRSGAMRAARLVAGNRFQLVEARIQDREAVSALLGDVDVVCHLAALAGVRPSIAEPLRYLDTNITGTGVVVACMRNAGMKRLVFASSSSVYGARSDGAAFRESDPCLEPASPYAATKRMNELQLTTYRLLFGFGIHALRFFTVYGPRQRPDMAIHKFMVAVTNGQPITLFGDGSSRRDYTYIDDIVQGTVAAIESVQPGELQIINLGGTATTSLRELVAAVEKATGRAADIRWLPDQPGDVPLTFADVSRARDRYGYAPTTSLAEGLARFRDWLASHSG